MATLFRLLLLVLLAAPLASTQGPATPQPTARQLQEARDRYEEALEQPQAHLRVQGVRSLVAKGWARTFPWLSKTLDVTRKNRDKLHKRYRELGRLINDKTTPYEHVRRLSPRSKIADMQRELVATKGKLERDEKVIAALLEGMGSLFQRLDGESRARTVTGFARALKSARKPADIQALAETLGHLVDRAAVEALLPLVAHKKPVVRIAVLEALGRQGDPAAAEGVGAALADPFWQVQATAVRALVKIAARPAVTALIGALAGAEGRIVQDIMDGLKKLTGQDFKDNHALWKEWWEKNGDRWRAPGQAGPEEGDGGRGQGRRRRPTRPGSRPAPVRPEHKGGTSFYGITTRSKRIIYILDISNSMNLPLGNRYAPRQMPPRAAPVGKRKIDQAIKELIASITSLPPDATFNIVFYNHEISRWRKKQIVATAKNKQAAIEWAKAVRADGNTNIFDALEEAFKMAGRGTFDKQYKVAADTFFLLSDGVANRGRLVAGGAMRKEVARLNRTRRVVIHTIALGSDADVPFMRGLARDTGGQFVQFNEQGRVPQRPRRRRR